MSCYSLSRGIAAATVSILPVLAFAGDITVSDPYARVSRPGAPSGAAFMIITNSGNTDDRLIAATSDIAKRVELHTHLDQGDGVMKMAEIEGGIPLPAGASHVMQRGGDHVMFMGLVSPLEQGGEVSVTLVFEQAGDIAITIPVDNTRQPDHGAMSGHGKSN